MTVKDRVFENDDSFEVSGKGNVVELYVFEFSPTPGMENGLRINIIEENGYDSQNAQFYLTASEVTALKEFLIKKGY